VRRFQDPRAILLQRTVLENKQGAGGRSGGIAHRESDFPQTGIHREDFHPAAMISI
jgi:hypothetical protein